MTQELVKSIKEHEGFRGDVYQDHLGFDTVGFGTKMPLTEKESLILLQLRLHDMVELLKERKPLYVQLPKEVQNIIAEMTYQMGVAGVLKFSKTWQHLEQHDFEAASVEMLDSKWAKQTPKRALELSTKMKSIKE